MDPGTAAIVSMVMSGVGTVMAASSAMQQSQASKDAANYNAAVQRNNAIAADYQAQDAYKRGEKAVEDHLRKTAALRGKQTATMAANGVDISEGTPLNILTDTELFAEIDTNTIRNNAATEAWGFKNQAANYNAQGTLASMSARNADPMMAGVSTLISGGASVADKWYQYNKVT
jgi:type II secretory pathway pseudopilin PulG